jgi:hypothetical protein
VVIQKLDRGLALAAENGGGKTAPGHNSPGVYLLPGAAVVTVTAAATMPALGTVKVL